MAPIRVPTHRPHPNNAQFTVGADATEATAFVSQKPWLLMARGCRPEPRQGKRVCPRNLPPPLRQGVADRLMAGSHGTTAVSVPVDSGRP